MDTNKKGYSEEETAKLIEEYIKLGNDGIQELAEKFGKTVNSIRAKLVREKVYITPDKSFKERKNGPSKKEILMELEKLGIDVDGLEGATKQALSSLKNKVLVLNNKVDELIKEILDNEGN